MDTPLNHRDTRKYKEHVPVYSEFCEGRVTTYWIPYDYTDEEIDKIIEFRISKGVTKEELAKIITHWEREKIKRDNYWYDKDDEKR